MVTTSGDSVDVVIVGAGICGTMLAAKLGSAGKRVVVLEQGPARDESALVSSQLWSRRLKWDGPPVGSGGPDFPGYSFNTGWGLGGSGIHHYAQWPRMKPEDFRTRSLYGQAVDWPLAYDDLRPYYDRVQEEVGIAGDHTREVWRPPGAPYPMPPLPQFPQATALARGFEAIGLRTAPMPLAINSVPYKGRPQCLYDGWCDAGCPIGALANPFVTYAPVARGAGVEFRTGCSVTQVLTEADRALGVVYYDAKQQRQEQRAAITILAGNAVQNTRLLLNSSTDAHPKGLANGSDWVGRGLLAHVTVMASGIFDHDLQNYLGVTGGALISQENYGKARANGPFGSMTWAISSARKPNEIIGLANTESQLFGADYDRFLHRAARGLATMVGIAEQMPLASNRIALAEGKDAYGLPLVQMINAATDNDHALAEVLRTEGRAVMKAAGAQQIIISPGINWQHLAGGLRMGTDPAQSVCDGYGVTHEVRNLVLTGTGLFPTEGATHPTFTSHALTYRTADYLLTHWSALT